MSSGRLGAADLAATTNTTVYTVPASTLATVSVSICNRNTADARVRLAFASSDTPGNSEWMWYDIPVPGKGSISWTLIPMDAGKKIVAYSDTANVSVIAFGFEEAA